MLTEFGKALKKMLIDKDMKMQDLGKAMNCTTANISRMCHDTGYGISKNFVSSLKETGLFEISEIIELRRLESDE
jgi:DNA-binding Xre family transcriptional regulator